MRPLIASAVPSCPRSRRLFARGREEREGDHAEARCGGQVCEGAGVSYRPFATAARAMAERRDHQLLRCDVARALGGRQGEPHTGSEGEAGGPGAAECALLQLVLLE